MIRAVMFDMGGTLEDVYSDEISDKNTAEALYRVLQSHDIQVPYGAEELWAKVSPQITAYKKQSEITLRELKPEEIWVDWGFQDIPVDKEKLAACAEEIAHMWETTYYHRALRPRAAEMLKGLKEDLGLHISVVSNTGSLFQVFSVLQEYGIRQYFDEINLSSITGYRKPHPHIFNIALQQSGFRAEECAFVGDTVSRDVVGPRKMGYGEVFQITSFLTPLKDVGNYDGFAPDHKIADIYDVYTILKEELGK